MDSFYEIGAVTICDDTSMAVPITEKLRIEDLVVVIMNFNSDGIDHYDEIVCSLYGNGPYSFSPNNLNLYMKNLTTPPARLFIEEPPVLELKAPPSHLRCTF